jgi:hypothetical protein
MKKIIFLCMLLFSSLSLAEPSSEKCLSELYSRSDLASISNKMGANPPATFEQLANTEKVTEEEKPLISKLAQGVIDCHALYVSNESGNLHPDIRKALEENNNNRMALLSDLYNQKISYGDYIKQRKLAGVKAQSEIARADQDIANNNATVRQMEREQREKDTAFYIENMKRNTRPKATNCTSNRVGDTVYTNCR